MNSNHRDWTSLPVELLQMILQPVSAQQTKLEFCNIALVCKAWTSIVQAIAYKNITIKTVPQFRKFYNTIIYNSYLRIEVNILNVDFDTGNVVADEEEVSELLTSLLVTYLPNLEELYKSNLYACIPTLHTLLYSQLRRMKRLQYPTGHTDETVYGHYLICALLIKDRLKNLYITCSPSSLPLPPNENLNSQCQRLYNSLYQFNNLVDIDITKETNDGIQILEYIVEVCQSLKNIKLHFLIIGDNNQTIPLPPHELLKYIPRSSIKSLEVHTDGPKDYNLLLYIMHKFRQLRSLNLHLNEDDPKFDARLTTQLLEYVSKIDKYLVNGFSVNYDNLMETVGSFWKNTSSAGSEKLWIDYTCYCSEFLQAGLCIKNKEDGGRMETNLVYPAHVDFNWRSFMDFIMSSGKFIGELHISIGVEMDELHRSELPAEFLPQILLYCPNLRSLQLIGCILKQIVYSNLDFNKDISIDELYFKNCKISHDMFKQLSALLAKIEQLTLYDNSIYLPENESDDEETTGDSYIMINMPHTDVNKIVIGVRREIILVKVFVTTDESYYYYQVETTQDPCIKLSNEQEFAANHDDLHVCISCPRKLKLDITMEEDYYLTNEYILIFT